MINNEAKVILNVKGLKKYFKNKHGIVKAVDNVNFKLLEGEVLGLIGESGSGKTTIGRSLIRLYEKVNGQISLDNQIISGKRISRSKNKFFRKNVQMIFQDPHASLNGQKNIYSILKEPLKVNGIIKEKSKDLFVDWKDITNNFKYTFIKKYKQQELENYFISMKEALTYFADWETRFNEMNFDEMLQNNSYEDIFNAYFAYLVKRQFHELKAINSIYRGSSKIYKFYFEKQKEYRNGILSFDEKDVREAKEKVKNLEKFTKTSSSNVLTQEKLNNLTQEFKIYQKNKKEFLNNSKNYIKSYLYEYQSEKTINYNLAANSIEQEKYLFFQKRKIVFHNAKRILSHGFKKLKFKWLNLEQIDNLINSLNTFNKNILSQYDQKSILNFKVLKEEIKTNYDKNFDLTIYIKQAEENYLLYSNKEKEFENLIQNLKNQYVKNAPAEVDNIEKYNVALQKMQEAEKVFQKELDLFIEKFNQWEKNINHKIDHVKFELVKINEKQKQLDIAFDKKHNEFLIWLKQKMQASNKDEKEIKFIIEEYNQKVNEKKSTLKTFEIEMKVIAKTNEKLKHLLGMKNNIFSKMIIKNVIIDEIIYNSLEEVGLLRQFAYRYPHEFSGGQRQRIVIARALVTEPKVIIADEPIASLDISIQAQVINLLKELVEKKKIGMIFIAHDLSMVEYIADNVIIMHLGKIVERGKTEEIYNNPLHPYTINLFNSIPKISNANQKFEASSFELNYLQEQEFPNIVEEHLIEGNHKIYGTHNQIEKWTKTNEKK